MNNKIRLILAVLLTLCMFSPGPKGESLSEGSIYGNTAKTAQPTNVPPETPGFGIMSGIGTLITCFFFTAIYKKMR